MAWRADRSQSAAQGIAPRTAQPPVAAGDGRSTPLADGDQPRNEALPAANRENGLRIGRAARASSDIAVQRDSAGRIVAKRKAGARRAKCAMWHGPRRHDKRRAKAIAAHGSVPRRREQRASKVLGHGGRPSNKALPARRIATTICD